MHENVGLGSTLALVVDEVPGRRLPVHNRRVSEWRLFSISPIEGRLDVAEPGHLLLNRLLGLNNDVALASLIFMDIDLTNSKRHLLIFQLSRKVCERLPDCLLHLRILSPTRILTRLKALAVP